MTNQRGSPPEKRCPLARTTTREDGNHSNSSNITDTIIQHFDTFCTASAVNAHELVRLAATTENGVLVRLALHLERIARELHAIGQVLPAALMLATLDSEVAA